MENLITFDPALTRADRLVLEELVQDIRGHSSHGGPPAATASGADVAKTTTRATNGHAKSSQTGDQTGSSTLAALKALNDHQSADFEPAVFNTVDLVDLDLPKAVDQWILRPYIRLASKAVRHKTDVVMITHLLLYSVTTIPSAVLLFRNFTPLHGVLHFVVQVWFMGAYTIMMHQHIHQRGILRRELALVDRLFPYVLDPLMGHTWNSYFYHHVKHHHVEGNGPTTYRRPSATSATACRTSCTTTSASSLAPGASCRCTSSARSGTHTPPSRPSGSGRATCSSTCAGRASAPAPPSSPWCCPSSCCALA